MKKVLFVFAIIAIVFGSAFAAAGDTVKQEIKVSVDVAPVSPTFQLYGTLTTTAASSADASVKTADDVTNFKSATTVLTADTNKIISADLPVLCFIKQVSDSKYEGSVTLTVSATALEGTTAQGKTYKTADPTISSLTAMNDIAKTDSTDTIDIRTTDVSTTATAVPTYSGRLAAAGDIAKFTVTWPKTDLPPATYVAYIQMTYTAV